jgi:hypothetical protein
MRCQETVVVSALSVEPKSPDSRSLVSRAEPLLSLSVSPAPFHAPPFSSRSPVPRHSVVVRFLTESLATLLFVSSLDLFTHFVDTFTQIRLDPQVVLDSLQKVTDRLLAVQLNITCCRCPTIVV